MKRGIALLGENTPASLADSLRCFERAIELRSTLPLEENSWYRYGLAAGWMNLGDALTRIGSRKNLARAVSSYDQAIVQVATLDLDENPLFRKRLALAWMNRGITLQQQETPGSLRNALASFGQAIVIARAGGLAEQKILACSLTNRSNALLEITQPVPTAARESTEEALRLIAQSENNDVMAAEIGLKARYVLVRAISFQLADRAAGAAPDELIGLATDAVEDGMKLARLWEARGERRFRALTTELFRFGARAYQMYQPHFLSEFLLEYLDPSHSSDAFFMDPQMHSTANDAIAGAISGLHRDGFIAFDSPRFDATLRKLRQLRRTRARLYQLQSVEA